MPENNSLYDDIAHRIYSCNGLSCADFAQKNQCAKIKKAMKNHQTHHLASLCDKNNGGISAVW